MSFEILEFRSKIGIQTIACALGNLAGFNTESRFSRFDELITLRLGYETRVEAFHQEEVKQDPEWYFLHMAPRFIVTQLPRNFYVIEFDATFVDSEEVNVAKIRRESRRILRCLNPQS